LFGSAASNSGYSTNVSVILGVSFPFASFGVGFFPFFSVLLSFPLALALEVGLFDSWLASRSCSKSAKSVTYFSLAKPPVLKTCRKPMLTLGNSFWSFSLKALWAPKSNWPKASSM
jgi:hypothetical protein